MGTSEKKIAVIGSNMVDLTSYITRMPRLGETLEAPSFAIGPGGKGANQAVAASRCGCEVWMVSKVGSDVFADNTIANFQKEGVHTRYVQKVEGLSSGVAPIFVDEAGNNSILIIKGANNALKPQDIDEAKEDLKDCAIILLQLEVPLETVYHAIAFGKEHGIPVLLNPAPMTDKLDIEKAVEATFLAPNETELSALTGCPVDGKASIEKAAAVLIEKGAKNVIVTCGGAGALYKTTDATEWVEPYRVQAVDTSGAGDAFLGAFASHYSKTHDVLASMRYGAVFAGLSVTKKGTQMSYPTLVEVEQALSSLK